MTLTYLRHRHRTAMRMSRAAVCAPSRLAHQGLARLYAARIEQLRQDRLPLRAARLTVSLGTPNRQPAPIRKDMSCR